MSLLPLKLVPAVRTMFFFVRQDLWDRYRTDFLGRPSVFDCATHRVWCKLDRLIIYCYATFF